MRDFGPMIYAPGIDFFPPLGHRGYHLVSRLWSLAYKAGGDSLDLSDREVADRIGPAGKRRYFSPKSVGQLLPAIAAVGLIRIVYPPDGGRLIRLACDPATGIENWPVTIPDAPPLERRRRRAKGKP